MWIQHLFSFIGTILHIFVDLIGTTLLGLFVGLGFAVATTLAAMLRIHRNHGRDAMVRHWNYDVKTALRVSLVCAAAIYGPILVWSLGKAVYVDHSAFVARNAVLRKSLSDKALHETQVVGEVKADLGGKLSSLKETCLKTEGANTALNKQTVMQQGSIDNCQNQALKLLTPEPLKLSVIYSNVGDQIGSITKIDMILITNKTVDPVSVRLECNKAITSITTRMLSQTGMSIGLGPRRLDAYTFDINYTSPALSPDTAIAVNMTHEGNNYGFQCSINKI
jgi:hypothetical protein